MYGVDGTTLRVADSDANRAHFGVSKSKRGESAYPLVRVVTLSALRSHLIVAASFGPTMQVNITMQLICGLLSRTALS